MELSLISIIVCALGALYLSYVALFNGNEGLEDKASHLPFLLLALVIFALLETLWHGFASIKVT